MKDPIWLLRGDPEAPGWKALEKDAKAENIDWLIFDRDAWVLLRAKEPPQEYEGLVPAEPPDGLYVDQEGRSVCVLGREEVADPKLLIEALGDEAKALLEKLQDPVAVLERLGRAY